MCVCACVYSFSHIIFFQVPSQVPRYSSLFNRAGSHCIYTPNAVVYISNPKLPVHHTPFPSPLATTSLLQVHKFDSFL